MEHNINLSPMLGSILEKSDGTIATTGSKDFTILRKEVRSPQSTLGHLALQKSQGFTGTFHPKDLRFERQRLRDVRDLRTLASS